MYESNGSDFLIFFWKQEKKVCSSMAPKMSGRSGIENTVIFLVGPVFWVIFLIFLFFCVYYIRGSGWSLVIKVLCFSD